MPQAADTSGTSACTAEFVPFLRFDIEIRCGLDPTGKEQARRTMRWKAALNVFDITLDGRLSTSRQ
ncbi:hypothetical protein ACIA8H_29855 [Streptomyces goshikiensis]|uniref:hypothetical protein n=1 Tax=Streptomyces goshikiensis TaxID=1942 RepID=UPI0037B5AF95